ncbi:MAG: hypothetical protein Q4D11_03635, partial [Rhodospirillales bacterium]|nr:hypothetical protein [Rhodospirillales bacterium]
MLVLLSSTFLSAPAWATETVNTYDDLLTALADENADVILDMNGAGIDLDGGNGITVGAGQTVVLKNIGTEGESAWTDTAFNIINQGTVAVDNIIFKDNNTSSTSAYIGGVIKNNDYHITSITNSVFDSNAAQSVNTSLWGGILLNGIEQDDMTNATIDLIQNVAFTNNTATAGRYAPHGGVILNLGARIGVIDTVLFENNTMTGPADQSGGAHGVAIDNNGGGFIDKITNSTFKNNYSYRTGSQEFSSSTNYHASAGAIDNYNYIGEISSCVFEGNHTSTESLSASGSGGAITNFSSSDPNLLMGYIGKIVDSKFINNHIETVGFARGGAVSSGGLSGATVEAHIDEITNVLFDGNYVKSQGSTAYGGAIKNSGIIEKIVADFTNNYAMTTTETANGGAIYNYNSNIDVIKATFEDNYVTSTTGIVNGGAILNQLSTIGTIDGNFIGNYSKSAGRASGGAINNNSSGVIGNISGDFVNNHVEATGDGEARGGALISFGSITGIKGNFINNYAKSANGIANGGAIRNSPSSSSTALGIEALTGNFESNYAESGNNKALGGAIYNTNTIGNIKNSSFIDNYASGNEESKGGAIYSTKDILITADNGASLFDGNKVNGESNAIYMQGTPEQGCSDCEEYTPEERVNLNLSAVNNGTITFNDAIDGNIYNINVYGDSTGVVKFNNLVKNVTNFTLGANSITHLGLNSKVYAQNMNISTSAIPGGNAVSSPIITVDVEVDKDNNTINAGQIHVDNDIEGDYRV